MGQIAEIFAITKLACYKKIKKLGTSFCGMQLTPNDNEFTACNNCKVWTFSFIFINYEVGGQELQRRIGFNLSLSLSLGVNDSNLMC